jgi:hypothetical protein
MPVVEEADSSKLASSIINTTLKSFILHNPPYINPNPVVKITTDLFAPYFNILNS